MLRRISRAIPVLAIGVLLAIPLGAQDKTRRKESFADLLPAAGLTREQMAGVYPGLASAQFQPPACVGRADGDSPRRQPGAFARGGYWDDGANAGQFAVASHAEPSGSAGVFGFRGAR